MIIWEALLILHTFQPSPLLSSNVCVTGPGTRLEQLNVNKLFKQQNLDFIEDVCSENSVIRSQRDSATASLWPDDVNAVVFSSSSSSPPRICSIGLFSLLQVF